MEKRELKFYEAPAVEVVEMETQKMLCASTNIPGVDVPGDGDSW